LPPPRWAWRGPVRALVEDAPPPVSSPFLFTLVFSSGRTLGRPTSPVPLSLHRRPCAALLLFGIRFAFCGSKNSLCACIIGSYFSLSLMKTPGEQARSIFARSPEVMSSSGLLWVLGRVSISSSKLSTKFHFCVESFLLDSGVREGWNRLPVSSIFSPSFIGSGNRMLSVCGL